MPLGTKPVKGLSRRGDPERRRAGRDAGQRSIRLLPLVAARFSITQDTSNCKLIQGRVTVVVDIAVTPSAEILVTVLTVQGNCGGGGTMMEPPIAARKAVPSVLAASS